MKRILLAVVMTLALPALILCQTNGKNTDKKGGDEQAVRQVIKELAAALGSNDSAGLDRIYDYGYTFVGDTGVLTTKAQRLAAFKSGEIKYESHRSDSSVNQINERRIKYENSRNYRRRGLYRQSYYEAVFRGKL